MIITHLLAGRQEADLGGHHTAGNGGARNREGAHPLAEGCISGRNSREVPVSTRQREQSSNPRRKHEASPRFYNKDSCFAIASRLTEGRHDELCNHRWTRRPYERRAGDGGPSTAVVR